MNTESLREKRLRTREKYDFYMDIRKKIIILMGIMCAMPLLVMIVVMIKESVSVGLIIGIAMLCSVIITFYIIERLWCFINRKVVSDFTNGR